MKRISLNTAPRAIRDFVSALPFGPDGVELELNGHVICKIIPPSQLSDAEKEAIVEKGWELVCRARERNKGVPAKVIEREVRQAVNRVRSGRK
jgi:hypothetical protein